MVYWPSPKNGWGMWQNQYEHNIRPGKRMENHDLARFFYPI